MLAIGIPLPVLPAQVHGTLGFGTIMVGWVIGIQSIATVLTRQYAGTTCDRRGVKTAVLLGLPMASLAGCLYLVSALAPVGRSEEHTSELQSLMRISYDVLCLTKKNK